MEIIIFLITFSILFLGELGDKTQLVVFNLSLEHEKSYKVGIGATIGFAVIVTIGVFFGVFITTFIPLTIVTIVSGIVFIIVGILETRGLKDLYRERKFKKDGEDSENFEPLREENINSESNSRWSSLKKNPYLTGFSCIFLMELGDKTQILTIALASIYPYPFEVWLGAFLALTSLAWMGAFFGAAIARRIPKFHLKLISVIIFIIIGILILVTSI
ncbi:MAG: TMEM165/GDT1 family protein [Candidatus Hermodarchaeota archaeon]